MVGGVRRHYRFACGTCGDRTWVIRPGDGAWLISCNNGHQLVPSGGTEFVIEDRDEGMREVQRGDQQGSSHGGHPSRAQADRDTSVLSETEARERADGGSDRRERGEDGRTVTVDVQIWEEMNQKYLEVLRARDDYAGRAARWQSEEEKRRMELFTARNNAEALRTRALRAEEQVSGFSGQAWRRMKEERDEARAEVQKQRERANRSQNEASARVSELRSLNHRYEAMQARAERLEGELARVRAEFDDNNAILEDTINRQAERIKELITSNTIVSRPDKTERYTEAWDKLMEIAPQFKDALEELMLDE